MKVMALAATACSSAGRSVELGGSSPGLLLSLVRIVDLCCAALSGQNPASPTG
jgi:hypothetical protein